VAASLTAPAVVCLYGELGSGKTTFVQGVAKGLGIDTRLLSPTFIIVRRYPLKSGISFFYHIDLYRTKSVSDLEGLGLREIFSDPHAVICIEWAQRLGSFLPKQRTDIHFSVISEGQRKIEVRSENSENSERLEYSEDSENQKNQKVRKSESLNI